MHCGIKMAYILKIGWWLGMCSQWNKDEVYVPYKVRSKCMGWDTPTHFSHTRLSNSNKPICLLKGAPIRIHLKGTHTVSDPHKTHPSARLKVSTHRSLLKTYLSPIMTPIDPTERQDQTSTQVSPSDTPICPMQRHGHYSRTKTHPSVPFYHPSIPWQTLWHAHLSLKDIMSFLIKDTRLSHSLNDISIHLYHGRPSGLQPVPNKYHS